MIVCAIHCVYLLFQMQANTRKWLVEQSLKVPELQQLEPQVCVAVISVNVYRMILSAFYTMKS